MNQIGYTTPGNRALSAIRREWRISFGAIILAVILSLVVTPIWIPIVDIIIAAVVYYISSQPNVSHGEPCGRVQKTMANALMITALISFLINLFYKSSIIHLFYEQSNLNESIPFITSLIVFPIACFLSFMAGTRKYSSKHIHLCRLINEYSPDQPLFSSIIHGVYRKMLNLMGLICGIISLVDWTYYFLFYRNVNLNSPDRFFFFVVPTAIFIGSIFYVRTRFGIVVLRTGKDAFRAAQGIEQPHNKTILRFLIIKDNKLLLDVTPDNIQNMNIDTPVKSIFPKNFTPDIENARNEFFKKSNIKDFFLKILYQSDQPHYQNSVYHYLINIPSDEGIGKLEGEWTTLDWIDRYMKMGVVASELASEIHRFYTISMAWKTYDNEGRRRYPIKNYRPSFRLDDAKDWDVDYSDTNWLKIARHNQDNRTWAIKQLFSRRQKENKVQ